MNFFRERPRVMRRLASSLSVCVFIPLDTIKVRMTTGTLVGGVRRAAPTLCIFLLSSERCVTITSYSVHTPTATRRSRTAGS